MIRKYLDVSLKGASFRVAIAISYKNCDNNSTNISITLYPYKCVHVSNHPEVCLQYTPYVSDLAS